MDEEEDQNSTGLLSLTPDLLGRILFELGDHSQIARIACTSRRLRDAGWWWCMLGSLAHSLKYHIVCSWPRLGFRECWQGRAVLPKATRHGALVPRSPFAAFDEERVWKPLCDQRWGQLTSPSRWVGAACHHWGAHWAPVHASCRSDEPDPAPTSFR